jgi:hypothetical protein
MISILIYLSNRHSKNKDIDLIETEELLQSEVKLKLESSINDLYKQPLTHAQDFHENEKIRSNIINRTEEPWFFKAYANYLRDIRRHTPDDFDAFKESILKYTPYTK